MSNKGKRYGVCENFEKCNKAKAGEKIELDELDDFICPECHSDLQEVKPVKGPNRKLIGGAAVLVLLGGGAAAYFALSPSQPELEGLSLNVSSQELLEGDIDTLKVTNTPVDVAATYIWTSSNEKVAKVDSNGVVTMTGEGQATILVTAVENAAAKDSCIYTVTESMDEGIVDVESMTFMETEKDMQLKAGEEKQLNIDCSPGNANEMVSWESENTNIATVGNDGMVKAVASGSTTITAVTGRSGTKASIKVTVTKEQTGGTSDLHLSGRIWEGPTVNGKPHGIGVMKFTSSQVIDSRDPNKTMANKGDYLTGAKYDNGKLVQGQLHRTDGTQKAIVIGQ